ncbi:MAG: hypothetical protein ACHQ5A_07565, partial [Opitutales bacterium]
VWGRAPHDSAGPGRRPTPDLFLDIDRDRHVNGYAGLYTALADEYVKAFLDGRTPGVRTAGTGTTSANTPPVAVGNVPWNGHNPPKYLNAEFAQVEVRVRDGWRRVGNGEQVEVPAGPARIRVGVTNTAEAQWLAPGRELTEGGVFLVVHDEHGGSTRHPLAAAVAFLGEATFPEFCVEVGPGRPTEVVLDLLAEQRTAFGERFHVRLKGQADAERGPR